jgi:hypothetical protein
MPTTIRGVPISFEAVRTSLRKTIEIISENRG